MLIELPDGNWIDPKVVQGVRLLGGNEFGPRVTIDSNGVQAAFFLTFDDMEAARGWVKKFGNDCNQALAAA